MINTIDHIINIDLANKINMNQSINIKQNDTNSHKFIINIFNNSLRYDLTGLTAKIYFLKADSTKIFQDCTLDDAINGKMNCILSTQTLSFAGIVSAEITIYGTSGEVLTSITFDFNVTKVLRDDLAIESTSEFTALTTALNSIEAAISAINAIEAWNTAVLQNGWTADSAIGIQYFKKLGIIYLNARLSSGTTTEGTIVSSLPSGYRPKTNLLLAMVNSTTGAVAYLVILSTGNITISNAITFTAGTVILGNISYRGDN